MPSRFATQIRSTLRAHQIKDTQPLLVAVSGGADSVALLRGLAEWSPGRLLAVYVDHKLRVEAEVEARFVEETATRLDAAFTRVAVDTKQIQAERRHGVEEAARTGRYQALLQLATEQELSVVVTMNKLSKSSSAIFIRVNRASRARCWNSV